MPVRRRTHFNALRTGRHHCKPLQARFGVYGEDAFSWVVVEEVRYGVGDDLVELLREAEQGWFSRYDRRFVLNKNTRQFPRRFRLRAVLVEMKLSRAAAACLKRLPKVAKSVHGFQPDAGQIVEMALAVLEDKLLACERARKGKKS
jgi:hypothetical protein